MKIYFAGDGHDLEKTPLFMEKISYWLRSFDGIERDKRFFYIIGKKGFKSNTKYRRRNHGN